MMLVEITACAARCNKVFYKGGFLWWVGVTLHAGIESDGGADGKLEDGIFYDGINGCYYMARIYHLTPRKAKSAQKCL